MVDQKVHNGEQGVVGVSDQGFLIVTENYYCPNWESSESPIAFSEKVCWYCKYSDFRKMTNVILVQSICANPNNKVKTKFTGIMEVG